MTSERWTKIDNTTNPFPSSLDSSDICYYAREYWSGEGYSASPTNNLVQNFKKPPSYRGSAAWSHRDNAVRMFATEVSSFLDQIKRDLINEVVITTAPCSKKPDHPEYNGRMDDLKSVLRRTNSEFIYIDLIAIKQSMEAQHLSSSYRSISEKINNFIPSSLSSNIKYVILIDDVITTGTTFKACKDVIFEKNPSLTNVIGVFWARAIRR